MHFVILMYLGVSHECLTFDEPMPRGRPRGDAPSLDRAAAPLQQWVGIRLDAGHHLRPGHQLGRMAAGQPHGHYQHHHDMISLQSLQSLQLGSRNEREIADWLLNLLGLKGLW